MKKIAVLASGSATSGGGGFEKLALASKSGALGAEVVCVLSNYQEGGVFQRAKRLGIRFEYFNAPWTADRCQELIGEQVDLISMSGWLKRIVGLDSTKTINIHPGPLPRFGGHQMYGHHVHEAVLSAYHRGELCASEVTMHFVTSEYDKGPVFFRHSVPIEQGDTAESLGKRVNAIEHKCQWLFTKHVLEGRIAWDGVNPESLVTV